MSSVLLQSGHQEAAKEEEQRRAARDCSNAILGNGEGQVVIRDQDEGACTSRSQCNQCS